MSAVDKLKNAGQDTKGKIKEAAGRATGDKDTEAEGQADQIAAGAKKTGEAVKDTVKDIADAVKANAKDESKSRDA